MKSRPPLESFANNIHSQSGEDGILTEILDRIGVMSESRTKWCVEFGAWDGKHLSNTYNLITNHGFRAVLIEGEAKRHKQLCRNLPSDEIIKICRFVGFEAHDSLDCILGETEIPQDFDFLSIDIDGCDYHVWDSLKEYQPKLVCIEFNPTIPVDLAYVQPRDFSLKYGNGVKALDNLAIEKGYTTVALTHANLIAVRNDLVQQVLGDAVRPIEEMADGTQRRFIFMGYDGTLLSNFEDFPTEWHPTRITIDDMQILPRFLRKYSGSYTWFHWAGFGLLDYWRRFRRVLRRDSSNVRQPDQTNGPKT